MYRYPSSIAKQVLTWSAVEASKAYLILHTHPDQGDSLPREQPQAVGPEELSPKSESRRRGYRYGSSSSREMLSSRLHAAATYRLLSSNPPVLSHL